MAGQTTAAHRGPRPENNEGPRGETANTPTPRQDDRGPTASRKTAAHGGRGFVITLGSPKGASEHRRTQMWTQIWVHIRVLLQQEDYLRSFIPIGFYEGAH